MSRKSDILESVCESAKALYDAGVMTETKLMEFKYEKPDYLNLKTHPTLTEKWVQDRIVDDPTILGLGDLTVKDRERNQPRAGRLDLLLEDIEDNQRYEVEIQLGKTDESHIIRTIEYWDIERKRYPHYDHVAVIIAEEITSRFLNVVALFNGNIPIIAIQMRAIRIGNSISLIFTKVLDQIQIGLMDEDEPVYETADRKYWENRGFKDSLATIDELFEIIKNLDSSIKINFNRGYIGLTLNGRSNNFISFNPRKGNHILVRSKIDKHDEIEQKMESAGLIFKHDRRNCYIFRLGKNDVKKHEDLLKEIFSASYNEAIQ